MDWLIDRSIYWSFDGWIDWLIDWLIGHSWRFLGFDCRPVNCGGFIGRSALSGRGGAHKGQYAPVVPVRHTETVALGDWHVAESDGNTQQIFPSASGKNFRGPGHQTAKLLCFWQIPMPRDTTDGDSRQRHHGTAVSAQLPRTVRSHELRTAGLGQSHAVVTHGRLVHLGVRTAACFPSNRFRSF